MKKGKILLAAVFAAVLALLPLTKVSAASVTISGGTHQLGITRKITGVSNPVTNTFKYTVVADDATHVTGLPTIADLVFTNSAPDIDGVVEDSTLINFDGVSFDAIGDYYFTITETSTTDATAYPLDATSYKVAVSVRGVVGADNRPTGAYEVLAGVVPTKKNNESTKPDDVVFTSGAIRTYVEINHSITGNMVEVDKCFAYTFTITGVDADDSFTVSAPTGCTNSATIKSGGTVYLRNTDTATIGLKSGVSELPVGANYTLTKVGDADYTVSIDSANVSTITKTTVATDATDFNTKNKTGINEHREGNLVTGILFNFWPYILMLIVAGFGIFLVSRRANKEDK